MPENIVPITQLDKAGLVADQPPVALPPNAFSDCLNVRFKDGVVRKMEGEVNIFDNGIFLTDDIVKYVAWWPSPNLAAFNSGYYLVIIERDDIDNTGVSDGIKDFCFFIKPGDPTATDFKGRFNPSGEWQHTFFQGGFALIINNGIDVPQYVLDPEGNEEILDIPDFARLPGWDSYNVNEVILDGEFQLGNSRTFDLGQTVDFSLYRVVVEVFTSETDPTPIIFANGVDDQTDPLFVPAPLFGHGTFNGRFWNLYTDATSRTTAVVFGGDDDATDDAGDPEDNMGLAPGMVARITIRSINPVQVRAGVIRSFGDFLVAGNLTERDLTDTEIIVRSLPGVVRSSDVAAPGAIPNNWNPFAVGVSTADEFVVTQDGIIQDLVELQSNLYIYSNSSISVMRLTGNAAIPLTVTPVTTSYGCLTTEGVLEYDGKHVVVGSQDIYLFGGHPGSIQSIGDGRVRNLLYDRINPLEESSLFMLRHQQQDEIWICYASVDSIGAARDEALIWNYRNNTWTKRTLPSIYSGDVGPIPGGGLPSAQIELTGTASNNGIIDAGEIDVQTFTVDAGLDIDHAGAGEYTTSNIVVGPDFPTYDASGPALFDIALPTPFSSGSVGRELHMTFIGLEAASGPGALTVFGFDVQLPAGLMDPTPATAATIIATLRDRDINPEFSANFRVDELDQVAHPGEFVIVGTNPAAVTTTLTFGDPRFRTRGSVGLTRTPDDDVVGTFIRDVNAPADVSRYLVSFNLQDNINKYHFFIIDPPTDALLFGIPQGFTGDARDYEDMFDEMDGEDMYDDGRGGEPARRDAGGSQRMYRTVSGQEFVQIASLDEPFLPRVNGIYDFIVEYPGTVDLNSIELESYTLTETTNGTASLATPSRRTGNANAAPQLMFTTEHLIYDETAMGTGSILGDYVLDPNPLVANDTTLVVLSGNFLLADHRQRAADHLRDAFFNEPVNDADNTGIWTAHSGDPFTVDIMSRVRGAYRLTIAPNVYDVSVVNEDRGVWEWQHGEPTDVEYVAGLRQAVYPRFEFTNAGSEFITSSTSILPATVENPALLELRLSAAQDANLSSNRVAELIENHLTQVDFKGWELTTDITANVASVQTALIANGLQPPMNPTGLIETQNVPAERPSAEWMARLISAGNVTTGVPIATAIPGAATRATPLGKYPNRRTPSYIFLQIRNAEATTSTGLYANQELLILRAPDGDDAEDVAEDWIARLRRAAPRLNIRNEGSNGEFSIAPNNYGDLANFVLVPTLNNNLLSNLETCQALLEASFYYTEGAPNRIQLNPASTIPFINLPHFVTALGYSEFESGIGSPGLFNRSGIDPNSEIQGVSLIFDTIRSWPEDEVNFNFEVPIFAARQNILGLNQSLTPVNKILGADIGWTTPLFSITPREDTFDMTGATRTITGNDEPRNYESYVERKTLGLTPEFDTEQLSSVALWVDGSTVESFGEEPNYNRLEIRSAGTNNPGVITDLDLAGDTSQTLKKNTYFVSEDYKVDLRTNGRFINIKITDNITDTTAFDTTEDVNQAAQTVDEKVFRQDAEWRLSGVQLELTKTGTR